LRQYAIIYEEVDGEVLVIDRNAQAAGSTSRNVKIIAPGQEKTPVMDYALILVITRYIYIFQKA
jgi:hypothetical protein